MMLKKRMYLIVPSVFFVALFVSDTIRAANLFGPPPAQPGGAPGMMGGFDPSLFTPEDRAFFNQLSPEEQAAFANEMNKAMATISQMSPEELDELERQLRQELVNQGIDPSTLAPAQPVVPQQPIQPQKPAPSTPGKQPPSGALSVTRSLAQVEKLITSLLGSLETIRSKTLMGMQNEVVPLVGDQLLFLIEPLIYTLRTMQSREHYDRMLYTGADDLYTALVECDRIITTKSANFHVLPAHVTRKGHYDPYEILAIPYDSSVQQIEKAYQTLRKQYDPEMLKTASAANAEVMRAAQVRFAAIRDAYEELRDQNYRKQIDRARREQVELHIIAQEKAQNTVNELVRALSALQNRVQSELQQFMRQYDPIAASKKEEIERAEKQRQQEQQQRAPMPRPAYSDVPAYGEPVVWPMGNPQLASPYASSAYPSRYQMPSATPWTPQFGADAASKDAAAKADGGAKPVKPAEQQEKDKKSQGDTKSPSGQSDQKKEAKADPVGSFKKSIQSLDGELGKIKTTMMKHREPTRAIGGGSVNSFATLEEKFKKITEFIQKQQAEAETAKTKKVSFAPKQYFDENAAELASSIDILKEIDSKLFERPDAESKQNHEKRMKQIEKNVTTAEQAFEGLKQRTRVTLEDEGVTSADTAKKMAERMKPVLKIWKEHVERHKDVYGLFEQMMGIGALCMQASTASADQKKHLEEILRPIAPFVQLKQMVDTYDKPTEAAPAASASVASPSA